MTENNIKNWLVSIFIVGLIVTTGVFNLFSAKIEASTSGSDYYGYSREDELPFFWEEINSTGTLIKAGDWTGDADNGYYTVGLPGTFNFNYYGNNYGGSNIYIGTNGLLSFSTAQMTGINSYWNRKIPYSNSPNRYIAPFWDNFEYIEGKTQVYYEIKGGAASEYLVVEYVNLINKGAREPCTFEVILNETTNEVWFLYKDLPRNQYGRGYSATIGLEDIYGRGGIEYSYNKDVLREEMVVHFTPNGISDTVTATSTSFAPPELWSGNTSVVMLRLNLSVATNAAQLYSLRVYQEGSAGVDNISAVKLYMDSNGNGIYDPSIDTYIGSQALTDAAIDYATFYSINRFFRPLKPLCLFILLDVPESITPGATIQLSILAANNIDLERSIDDPVIGAGGFPLQSAVSTLMDNPQDLVTVTHDPNVKPPTTVSSGERYVFCKLNFTIDANDTIIRNITVNLTGNVTNQEVNWISAWHDLNGNGIRDIDEPQIGSGMFDSSGSAVVNIWGSSFKITSGTTLYMLLQLDINPSLNGKTVGLEIDKFDKIKLKGNDLVVDVNFPMTTSKATISNSDMIHVSVDPNPASLTSLRADQRDAPVLKVNLSITSGSVMIFNIMFDKNKTGIFMDSDMPYQRMYEDVNDNGVVDEGVDVLLAECTSFGPMFWFNPMIMPWTIIPSEPLVLLFTIDISEFAPTGPGDSAGINITFPNNIGYNPMSYSFDYNFPIESKMYPITTATTDSLLVSGDDLILSTIFPGDSPIIERLNITSSSNEVGIMSITVHLNGTGTNTDIQDVKAYYDINKDGKITALSDILLNTAFFDSSNYATINFVGMSGPFIAKAGIVKSILLVYTVRNNPTSGVTVGIDINSTSNFTLDGINDNVNPTNFPIYSSLATINYQDSLVCAKDPRIAPISFEEGSREMLILKLNFSTITGLVSLDALRVGLLGTIKYSDIGKIYAFEDVNDNAYYDRNIDTLIGLSSFNTLGWSYIDLSLSGPFIVYAGINRTLLLLVDIEYSAFGKTLGLDIANYNVSVSAPDNVSNANFPIQSSLVNIIGSAHNTVTVTRKDLAPINVYQAEEGVEMLKLILSVDSGSVSIKRIKIGFNGSASFDNITRAYIYWDVNKNDIIDPIDILLDRNSLYMGRVYFKMDNGFLINASEIEHLIIAYDISIDAMIGKTVGVLLENEGNISLECMNDTVSAFNDYNSTASMILAAIVDTLTVTWSDISPAEVYEEDLRWEILRLVLSAGSGDIYLESITINRTGTAEDTDINWISIIHDINNNGKYDVGLDKIIGNGWFSGTTAVVPISTSPKINASSPETILIAVDIGWDAGDKVFGLEIEKFDYINVKAPDVLANENFPITSSLINIQNQTNDIVTVQSTSLAPAKAYPGDSAVPMLLLNLSVDKHTTYFQNCQIYLDGTAGNSEVNVVDLYIDVDADGVFTSGLDRLVGTGTFSGGVAWCWVMDLIRITPTEPLHIIGVYQVLPTAIVGRTMGANVSSASDVWVSWSDSVSSNDFPHYSSLTIIDTPTIDNLTLQGNSKAPAQADPGDNDVVMLQLNLSMDQNEGHIKTIKINKIGTAADSDINAVNIYEDVNGNGIIDSGVDSLLGQESLTNGNATIQIYTPPSLGYKVTTSTTSILIAYDISSTAATGVTVGGQVIDNSSIVLEGIDDVKNTNMPIQSTLTTIAITTPDILNVSGGAISSVNMAPGQSDIDMLYVELNVSTLGNVKVILLKVKLDGQLNESHITNVRLYEDQNSNYQYDSGTDLLVGTGTTFSAKIAFWILSYTISSGAPKTLIVVLDLLPSAPEGESFNVSLQDVSYVSVSPPDNINPFSPIESNTLKVMLPASTLTVIGTSLMPVSVLKGSTNIVVEQLTLSCDVNNAEITAITIGRFGTLADSYITNVKLYDDANDNGVLDGVDVLLDKDTFSGSSLSFSPLSYTITNGIDENLLIVIDISAIAPPSRTLWINLNSNTTITLSGIDIVSSANFPIVSGTTTILDIADTLTVTGNDKAPGTITVDTRDVVMEELIFSVSGVSVEITSMNVGLIGSAGDSDISAVKLYLDINEDGIYDLGTDTLLDTQQFLGGSASFTFSRIVNGGDPIHMLVAIDIPISATHDITAGVEFQSNTNISLSGIDLVSSTNFPLSSSLSLIQQTIDTLIVIGTDNAPTNLEANQADVLMLNLMLTAQNNSILFQEINCEIIGTAGWSNITHAHLYKDENANGNYDTGVDSLVDTVDISSTAIDFSISETISFGTPLNLLITIDTNPIVSVGDTIGLRLFSNADITVDIPDIVSSANFPIMSSLSTLIADITRPNVVAVKLSPSSLVSISTISITIEFSEDMNQLINPTVTFGKVNPYLDHVFTYVNWIDARHWRGTYDVETSTGDGLNHISIIGAEDLAGNILLAETSTTFYIDTTAPIVDAGMDINVTVGTKVIFNGSSCHDNYGILSYNWSFNYAGQEQSLNGITPNHTFLIAGDYLVTLTVTDLAGNSANDTIRIHVNSQIVERPQVIDTIPVNNSENNAIDTVVFITFSISMDKSSLATTFSISPSIDYEFSWGDDYEILRIDFTTPLSYNTIYTIIIGKALATIGGILENQPFILSFTTEMGSEPTPSIIINSPSPDSKVLPGDTITITGSAPEFAGSEVVVTLGSETATGVISFDGSWSVTITAPDVEGNYTLTVTVDDQSTSMEVTIKDTDDSDGDGGSGDDDKTKSDSSILIGVSIAALIVLIMIIIVFFLLKKKKAADTGNDETHENTKDSKLEKNGNSKDKLKEKQVRNKLPLKGANKSKGIRK